MKVEIKTISDRNVVEIIKDNIMYVIIIVEPEGFTITKMPVDKPGVKPLEIHPYYSNTILIK